MTILCEHERAIVYLVAHEGYNPSYKWTNPTYPTYNPGYNLLSKGMTHEVGVLSSPSKVHNDSWLVEMSTSLKHQILHQKNTQPLNPEL